MSEADNNKCKIFIPEDFNVSKDLEMEKSIAKIRK